VVKGEWDLVLETEGPGYVITNNFPDGSVLWIGSSDDLIQDDVSSEKVIRSLRLSFRKAFGCCF
jgi:hypothetical protein